MEFETPKNAKYMSTRVFIKSLQHTFNILRNIFTRYEDEQGLQQPGRDAVGHREEVELGCVEPGLVLGEAVPQRGHQRVQLPRLQLPGLLPQQPGGLVTEEVRGPDPRSARPVGGRQAELGLRREEQLQVGRPELAALLSARHLGAAVDLAGPRVAQHELAVDLAHHKHVAGGVAVAVEVARDLVRLGRVEH